MKRLTRPQFSCPLIIAVAAVVGAACGSDAGDAVLELEFASGQYEVPTSDPSLEGANLYPTTKVELYAVGAQYKLEYDLPAGLIGSELALEFTGPRGADGVFDLVGAHGTAACTYDAGALRCDEAFVDLAIDHDAVTDYWTARGLAGKALQRRQQVSQLFADDPIGILRAGP